MLKDNKEVLELYGNAGKKRKRRIVWFTERKKSSSIL